MQLSTLTTPSLTDVETAALAVGVFAEKELSPAAQALDEASQGAISAVLESEFKAKAKSHIVLRNLPGIAAQRVVLVGLGKKEKYNTKTHSEAENQFANYCVEANLNDVVSTLASIDCAGSSLRTRARAAAQAVIGSTYRYDATLSKKADPIALNDFKLWAAQTQNAEAQAGLREGHALGEGQNLARLLGDLPPNVCTPTYLGEQAKELAKEFPEVSAEVLEKKQIEALKMGSFLSVAKGSAQPPVFIELKYTPAENSDAAPIVLVGKGLTFDSGGISIKPANNMDEMKYDMCGAASVLGTFRAIAQHGLNRPVIGLIAACENMPSSTANKPGDIVTAKSGLTIEILNTDAEGRLVLCDALTYAERFNPAAVVNMATLTGACVVALGHHNSGLFSNNEQLQNELLEAAREANDPAWPMPIDDTYQEQLKSNFADVANIGTPGAGATTAACFLARFTENYPWAHLDIAGTAWNSGSNKGATGRPVPLLFSYLLDQSNDD
ncbi:MAG TPA: leucyl aminopeptidase [Paenalcaligenes sp.]|nr:leucyl aminopeptidase [Paenalcaligenes sp.]